MELQNWVFVGYTLAALALFGWVLRIVRRGRAVKVTDAAILGRQPAADPAFPGAQLFALTDPTRTVSKTHARLERRGDAWHITDLGSTNGVLLPSLLGTDIEVEPGTDAEVSERFLLGDAALRLQHRDR